MTDSAGPVLKQIKASAGSGKTYELTRTFLEYLRGAGTTPSPACGSGPRGAYGRQEILAVTFTNKAAAEMKERVIGSLKERALGKTETSPASAWNPRQAEAGLSAVLRRAHQLNIRTIDSLLTTIMRVFALDAALPPDFEICFDLKELFDPALDRFIARCAERAGPERALLDDTLEILIHHERKRGFLLMESVRDRLYKLASLPASNMDRLETDRTTMAEMLSGPWSNFRNTSEKLQKFIESHHLSANAHFRKYLENAVKAELFNGPPASAFASKPAFADCLNKSSKDSATPDMIATYEAHKQAAAEYRTKHAVLEGAYALAPCVELARAMAEDLRETMATKGMVPLHTMAGRVRDMLMDGGGVPEAWCRMGSRLHHVLIDEFQDTSQEQWSAMAPLAGECLSKGGSLVYVGDAKQAIYGWRGGDANLFDEIGDDPELASARPSSSVLEHNWRSSEEVVRFNNDFFQPLSDPSVAEQLAESVFKDAPSDVIRDFSRSLERTYAQTVQTLPPQLHREGGYIRLERVPGTGAELTANIEKRFMERMAELTARRPFSDIAVLVRSNDQAEDMADLLIRNRIPVITENSLSLARHPVVRAMVSFLRFLDYPPDDSAFFEFLSGPDLFPPVSGISREQLHDWLLGAKSPIYTQFSRDFPEVWHTHIEPFFKQAAQMTPYDIVRETTARLRVFERFPEDMSPVLHFLETVHLAGESGGGSTAGFLEFWDRLGREAKAPMPENADAVRIMTIHKSKGLEFPVVVAPFHDWPSKVSEAYARVRLEGADFLVPMRKDLGRPYWDDLLKNALEQVNLLYVAWTRAAEELHGFLPEKHGKGTYPTLKAVELIKGEEFIDGVLERGTVPAPSPVSSHEPPSLPEFPEADTRPEFVGEQPPLMAWLPRLRIYRHSLEDTDWSERTRGQAFHNTLEYMAGPAGSDLDTAMETALKALLDETPAPDGESDSLKQDIRKSVEWLRAQAPFGAWISRGRPEAEILDKHGDVHRADLLVEEPGRWVVLEYKTGKPRPEHEEQVRRYLSLLAEVGGKTKPPVGFIILLDHHEIREIRWEDAS